MPLRHLVLCFPVFFSCVGLMGCGGDAGGPAVMQEQPAYTEADASAAADYSKMQQDNQKKGYGS